MLRRGSGSAGAKDEGRTVTVTVTSASTIRVEGKDEKGESWLERKIRLKAPLTDAQIDRLRAKAGRQTTSSAGFFRFKISRMVNEHGAVGLLDESRAFVGEKDEGGRSIVGEVVELTVTSASRLEMSGTNQNGEPWTKTIDIEPPLSDGQVDTLREDAAVVFPFTVDRTVKEAGVVSVTRDFFVGNPKKKGTTATVTLTSASTLTMSGHDPRGMPWTRDVLAEPPLTDPQMRRLQKSAGLPPADFVRFKIWRTVNEQGAVDLLDESRLFVGEKDGGGRSIVGEVVELTVTSASRLDMSGTNQNGEPWTKDFDVEPPFTDEDLRRLPDKALGAEAPYRGAGVPCRVPTGGPRGCWWDRGGCAQRWRVVGRRAERAARGTSRRVSYRVAPAGRVPFHHLPNGEARAGGTA